MGLLDVYLDLFGEVSALAGVVGEGAGAGDGDEAAVGEVGDLDSAVDGDEDAFAVVGVGLVGVPVSLDFVGEDGWCSGFLLGCFDSLDYFFKLVVELVEEKISDA